ncbi:GntR family transcriptional regulator [Metaplanococcus flavidus]|uniref:GntR family transcriptional regulator n=1 Tax=Metaplanococcus flavidus TaxID=569883 RepID=A0ABW3L734_9BACL
MSKPQRKLPLYLQIKRKMVDRIKDNEWVPGDPIPSESQLMQSYNVSRTTIRQAIRDLSNDGIIETRRGTVARVKQTPNEEMQNPGVLHHESGDKFSIKVLRSKYAIDQHFAKSQLQMEADEEVYFLERLRLADGIPIGFQQLFTPAHIGEIIESEAASWFDIFPVLGMNAIYYSVIKENVTATLANQYEADLLGIMSGDPLIDIRRVTLGIDNRPIEYSRTKYVPIHFNYRIEIGH